MSAEKHQVRIRTNGRITSNIDPEFQPPDKSHQKNINPSSVLSCLHLIFFVNDHSLDCSLFPGRLVGRGVRSAASQSWRFGCSGSNVCWSLQGDLIFTARPGSTAVLLRTPKSCEIHCSFPIARKKKAWEALGDSALGPMILS